MRVVVQRVSSASVTIEEKKKGAIEKGLLIFLGIEHSDDSEDVDWLTRKIIALRIFSDPEGKMNLDIKAVNGSILVISQFTLHASTKKGNRPSFIKAARPDRAIPLYELFIHSLEQAGIQCESGAFGADMQVSLVNNGPVTIIMDSKNRS